MAFLDESGMLRSKSTGCAQCLAASRKVSGVLNSPTTKTVSGSSGPPFPLLYCRMSLRCLSDSAGRKEHSAIEANSLSKLGSLRPRGQLTALESSFEVSFGPDPSRHKGKGAAPLVKQWT